MNKRLTVSEWNPNLVSFVKTLKQEYADALL